MLNRSRSTEVAITGVMTALVCVGTILIRIPIPQTKGYINIGDSMIFFSALCFGFRIGGFAGGIGSALADIIGGFGNWAPFTLIIKGVEGIIVGKLAKKSKILALVIGGSEMILGYFIVELFLYGYGAAVAELPGNIFQAGFGILLAIPLYKAVSKILTNE
ncbi:MAG: ECF transporter S component [Methanomicrobia archaeon]|nr:ECF transporter S component [Methanomicrobia archaeon]RLF95279.1 MAG: ECF transporter S component [Thermococci archaeon]RLF95290.1 MAG: ECF transporter S component [Thermococci archaeon]RLG00559.1 MAG: ECF transporter S component [Thermococci archaeon]